MKNFAVCVLFVSSVLIANLDASSKPGYQRATVISVTQIETAPQSFVGGNPSDAPMVPEEYAYDIGLKVDCTLYTGRYESAIDYLPSYFRRESTMGVRVAKHWIYVSLPSAREVKLGLMSHRAVHDGSCLR